VLYSLTMMLGTLTVGMEGGWGQDRTIGVPLTKDGRYTNQIRQNYIVSLKTDASTLQIESFCYKLPQQVYGNSPLEIYKNATSKDEARAAFEQGLFLGGEAAMWSEQVRYCFVRGSRRYEIN
jgi:hypothetical protein